MFARAELERSRLTLRPTSYSAAWGEFWLGDYRSIAKQAPHRNFPEGVITMNPATISALSALAGSAIGALASVATTWLTHRHQGHMQRLMQEGSRRERVFG